MPDSRASDEENLKELGKRLRQARKAREYTLRDAALMLGMSPGYLSQLERGLKRPRVSTLVNLANRYQHSPVDWVRLAHPEQELQVVTVRPAAPTEWRSSARLYENAISDPKFRYPHMLTHPEIRVPEPAKEYIAALYQTLWDVFLSPAQVEDLYEKAIHDERVDPNRWLVGVKDIDFAVKRAVAEIYLRYTHEKERQAAEGHVGKSSKSAATAHGGTTPAGGPKDANASDGEGGEPGAE